jgi:hypothetical protein
MSYHILHQFDEQWLAELNQDADKNKGKGVVPDSFGDGRSPARRAGAVARESKQWAVVASILLATFALIFSLDASHRAESLQQRLDASERAAKR